MMIKPSKPLALVIAASGVGMIAFVLTNFQDSGEVRGAVPLFCVAVAAIVSFWLWAAFSKHGSLGSNGADPASDDERR